MDALTPDAAAVRTDRWTGPEVVVPVLLCKLSP